MATVVAFHAHPDDETLLTGGTLAKLAADGHRTVIVVATDGLIGSAAGVPPVRLDELDVSAAALGVARVVYLGYADSGDGPVLLADPPDRSRFVRVDIEEAAQRLAAILREERPEILLSYDRNGGYGHRDHVRVHEVGKRAAEIADVPRVLDATMPRHGVKRIGELIQRFRLPLRFDAAQIDAVYTARPEITHRIEVGRFARQRRVALAAHHSMIQGSTRFAVIARTLLGIPTPLLTRVLRWEWYAEEGADPVSSAPSADLFAPAPRSGRSVR
ncbi:PIG-L deacetylase family protein [Nocardia callitridis]|uniref:PIG-L family deacetylase n=1 Tax=Nocardia callitridis TaxID=648753 RepID=A0ABP9L241_9NOCA